MSLQIKIVQDFNDYLIILELFLYGWGCELLGVRYSSFINGDNFEDVIIMGILLSFSFCF